MGHVMTLHQGLCHEYRTLDRGVLQPQFVSLLDQLPQDWNCFAPALIVNLYLGQIGLRDQYYDWLFAASGRLQGLGVRSLRGFKISTVEIRITLEAKRLRYHAVILRIAGQGQRLVERTFCLVSAARKNECLGVAPPDLGHPRRAVLDLAEGLESFLPGVHGCPEASLVVK